MFEVHVRGFIRKHLHENKTVHGKNPYNLLYNNVKNVILKQEELLFIYLVQNCFNSVSKLML